MMTDKVGFTKGPWRGLITEYADGAYDSVEVKGESGLTVAYVRTFDTAKYAREGESNAHLIAAAPDMYEALEAMLGEYAPSDQVKNSAAVLARAARAKARGEA